MLAVTQLVSWGTLFYGFAVVAPEVTVDTGWSEGVVAGAFSVGLLVAGVAAPTVACQLARRDPRVVLTLGSLLGMVGVAGFATARDVVTLYLAWTVIGLSMAGTLYEPAMAVLVALDPKRRRQTLAVVTVAGGLASTVCAPIIGLLLERVGWRAALLTTGLVGGAFTAVLHARALPPPGFVAVAPESAAPDTLRSRPVRRLRVALLFEQGAIVATTIHYVGLLVDRGATAAGAGTVLAVMGLGKVAGRVALIGPAARRSAPAHLAAFCILAQFVALAVPLVTLAEPALFASAATVGAASGATTVLRPLLVVELVGAGPFASVSARLNRSTTVARAAAPVAVGVAAALIGWPVTWGLTLAAFAVAAAGYRHLARASE